MPDERQSRQRSIVVGLVFFILCIGSYILVQGLRRWMPMHEPLTPVEKREAGALVMPVLNLDAPPVAAASGAAATAPGLAKVEKWSLADQKGKVVMVNYFATWCGPCVEETPELAVIAKEFKDRGVVTVGVSMDRDEDRVGGEGSRVKALREFVKNNDVQYPLLMPADDSMLWKIQFPIPQTFLYDKQGRRARAIMGGIDPGDVRAALEELLKE